MEENKGSNRRSFVRKLLGLGAAAGATSLLFASDKSLIPLAQAGSGAGENVQIDQVNYGTATTQLWSTTSDSAALTSYATSSSGPTSAIIAQSESTLGTGVFGWASASTGQGTGVGKV